MSAELVEMDLVRYPHGITPGSIHGQICRLLAGGATVDEAAATAWPPGGDELDRHAVAWSAAVDAMELQKLGVPTPGVTDADIAAARVVHRAAIRRATGGVCLDCGGPVDEDDAWTCKACEAQA